MSDDLTQKLPSSPDGMLAQILVTVQNLSTRMESLEQRLGGLEQQFGSLEQRLGGLEQKVESLEQRIGQLEQKVEERMYDTRPIWEKVQADIAGLQEGQRSLQEGQRSLQEGQRSLQEGQRILQEGQDALRSDVKELRKESRNMDRRFSVLNDNIIQAQANYRELYDRVYDLEKRSP